MKERPVYEQLGYDPDPPFNNFRLRSRCRCGGKLSPPRVYHYGGGPIKELARYDGKRYRHCYSCHMEFFEEEADE